MDNLSEQCEEIEALKSIYGDQWQVETETNSFSMQISPDVKLYITFNSDYPSKCAPDFELLAPILDSDEKRKVSLDFKDIYNNNAGGPILFQWIEKLKEIVDDRNFQISCDTNKVQEKVKLVEEATIQEYGHLQVTHGTTIQDRKSVFQGHCCEVHCVKDTKIFLNYLLQNKKIVQATHNIFAYRITLPNGVVHQDCDDDGESHAGGRVLHLLQILNLNNVMVVITRWYGGTQLGPDRFKHINNAAREVLVQGGFIK